MQLYRRSILDEDIKRGELSDDTPIDDLALYINTQLYGLMIAWCMTDGSSKYLTPGCDIMSFVAL